MHHEDAGSFSEVEKRVYAQDEQTPNAIHSNDSPQPTI
jgi:hypothetical protein